MQLIIDSRMRTSFELDILYTQVQTRGGIQI